MEIDCSHYVILVCAPGHASYTALWEELGLKFVHNTFLGSDSELACPWFGFLPDSHHSIFQVLQQLFLKLTALPADSCFFPQWWAFSKALSTILSNCPAHPMLSLGTSCGGDRHNAKIGTRPLISHPQIYSLPLSLTLKSLCSFYHFCLLRFHHLLKLIFYPFPVSGIQRDNTCKLSGVSRNTEEQGDRSKS